MNNKHIVGLIGGLAAAFLLAIAFSQRIPTVLAQRSIELTGSAAISLTNALQEIETLYESNNTNTEITYNFASSGALQQQIQQGAPVDVFVSAGKRQMDALEEKDLLLSGTRRDLLRNRIVLITPQNGQALTSFRDLLRPEIQQIAIAEPGSVPAGKYAREVLINLGIYEELQPKLVFANNVRQVLTFVETSNVDAGIVYITDAKQSERVTLSATAPENLHSPIVYPVAVMKTSKNVEASKEYLNFLFTPAANTVFESYGFIPES